MRKQRLPKDFWTDEVDDSMYIVLREFLDELNGLAHFDKVTFRINSVGGDADAADAFPQAIRPLRHAYEPSWRRASPAAPDVPRL